MYYIRSFEYLDVDFFLFQPKELKKVSLEDASEGYIGKLQILRSGKARYGKKQ